MQKKINLKIKYREAFRPFAPAILCEDVQDYFELKGSLHTWHSLSQLQKNAGFHIRKISSHPTFSIDSTMYRSDLPAVTHVDYSARIQTVHRETNLLFWKLLKEFLRKSPVALW